MKMRLILGGQKLATIRVDFGQFNMCGMLWYLHKDHLFWIFGSKLVGEVPWTSHLMLNWFSKIPGKMLNFVKKGDWLIYTPCPESTIHFRNPTVDAHKFTKDSCGKSVYNFQSSRKSSAFLSFSYSDLSLSFCSTQRLLKWL